MSRRLRLWLPLVGFVVPSIVIGYGFVLPRNGYGGINELSIGFATTILGGALSYALGIREARKP